MLRAVLVGVLSLSAVACKSKSDSPQAQPGAVAGKVVEVSGAVTLRHGDVARPLGSGDTVEGDDVIETGADGSVVIELAHNLARWELGANRKAKVRESTAWGLPKKTEGANVEQNSAAAGRHAERSAAETGVSAESAPAPVTAAPPPAPAAAPVAEPTAGGAPPPPPPPKPVRGRTATSSDGKVEEKAKLTADVLDQESGAGGGAPSPAMAKRAAHEIVLRNRKAIQACLTKEMPTVSLRIAIDKTGKAGVSFDGKADVPDAVKSCVTSAIEGLSFAPAATTVSVEIAK
jgi:hypothetical protein